MQQVNATESTQWQQCPIIMQWLLLMMKIAYLGNFPLFFRPQMWPAVVPVYTVTLPIMIGLYFFPPAFTQFTGRLRVAESTV